jgi:outer membrane protein assembly factor BamB
VDSWYKNNWYNAYYGDADRLANGNVLIAAGSVSQNNGDARVFEVQKADGKVVWEFKLAAGYGVYRADRIDPPLVKPIAQ